MSIVVFAGMTGATPMALKETQVETTHRTGGYLLANGVSRSEADTLRRDNPGSVASRNTDGTYRVTQAR